MVEYFPGQKPSEQVKVLVRPFWMAMLWQILAFIILALLPIGILIALGASGSSPFEDSAGAITAVALPAYYLILVSWAFIVWLDFYLDVGIVTNERVVDIDQGGLFKRNIAELDSQVVQDVTAHREGIFQTIFDFGDVIIQTAGERPNFEFNGVRHPERIVNKVRESIGGRDESPDTAPGKISEAAEKMEEAAKELKKDAQQQEVQQQEAQNGGQPAQQQQQPTKPVQPAPAQPDEKSDDLPREYER